MARMNENGEACNNVYRAGWGAGWWQLHCSKVGLRSRVLKFG